MGKIIDPIADEFTKRAQVAAAQGKTVIEFPNWHARAPTYSVPDSDADLLDCGWNLERRREDIVASIREDCLPTRVPGLERRAPAPGAVAVAGQRLYWHQTIANGDVEPWEWTYVRTVLGRREFPDWVDEALSEDAP